MLVWWLMIIPDDELYRKGKKWALQNPLHSYPQAWLIIAPQGLPSIPCVFSLISWVLRGQQRFLLQNWRLLVPLWSLEDQTWELAGGTSLQSLGTWPRLMREPLLAGLIHFDQSVCATVWKQCNYCSLFCSGYLRHSWITNMNQLHIVDPRCFGHLLFGWSCNAFTILNR